MNRKTRIAVGALACVAALFFSTVAVAQPIGETIVKPDMIYWDVQVQNDGILLSVAGRDCVLDQSFERGETPFLDPANFAGVTLEDGQYVWELRATPVIDPDVKKVLMQARDSGEEKELAQELRREGLIPWEAIVQSGFFTVTKGRILLDDEEPVGKKTDPELTTKDFVILDDLIVDGSACIGFDCVNGEVFGFDTIRLKENNLRIKFDDTSVAASFPRTDWQLTANDSANGGASKFSIDDISGGRTPFTVEANAPSHSLYVDDGGRVGFGTSTPVVDLHVKDGDTPTLRLEQDTSSGFAAQTWDVAGNETSFFVRDATNGSTLPFRIRPGASSQSLVIDSDNDIGIGLLSPSFDLHVQRSGAGANDFLKLENTNAAAQTVRFELANNAATWRFEAAPGGGFTFDKVSTVGQEVFIRDANDALGGNATLTVDGSVEADNVVFPSSRAFKTDFVTLDPRDVLAKVAGLEMTSWRFKEDVSGLRHIGPIAEDWASAFPLGGRDTQVSVMDVGGVALTAIQGLNVKIEELEAEKAGLRAEIEELRAMVQAMSQGN